MTPYQILVDVLDQLRLEAPAEYKTYHPADSEIELLNAARSKAFLHLFLKARFGLLSFQERESQITEGSDDGGIDAYHIDPERKEIYFLQAKFRTNEKNFEEKAIEPEELLMMDIDRILDGETTNDGGKTYNSKVLAMARKIRGISDIGRYTYQVAILANARGITRQRLTFLTGGYPSELIDYKSCYKSLLFPLVSGTYYNAEQLHLSLSLSNKSAGAKISYTVHTEITKCEITVVFVPTIEIAKAMYKYRNSILQYNPRSYLGHHGQNVNTEIRKSIEGRRSNEFALFNNGITILSDETYLNERIGQKDRAQLVLVNPQIINGGQTAYTLSVIYREHAPAEHEEIFSGKEVLVKIITFEGGETLTDASKLSLIEEISRATNQQSAVTNADRRANDAHLKEIQRKLFDRAGLFVERKRGEFEDGVREGYIRNSEILDRNLLFRAALTAQGQISAAASRKLVAWLDFGSILNVSDDMFDKYCFAALLLKRVSNPKKGHQRKVSPWFLAKLYLMIHLRYRPGLSAKAREELVESSSREVEKLWVEFCSFAKLDPQPIPGTTPKSSVRSKFLAYVHSPAFGDDLKRFADNIHVAGIKSE